MARGLRMSEAQLEQAKKPKAKSVIKKSEHEIQCEFFKWWRTWSELKQIPTALCFAIPNSRRLSDSGRIYAWKEGLTAGTPDVFMAIPQKKSIYKTAFHGLFIEFKSEKGKPTPEQLAFIQFANAVGYKAIICKDSSSAIDEVMNYFNSQGYFENTYKAFQDEHNAVKQ